MLSKAQLRNKESMVVFSRKSPLRSFLSSLGEKSVKLEWNYELSGKAWHEKWCIVNKEQYRFLQKWENFPETVFALPSSKQARDQRPSPVMAGGHFRASISRNRHRNEIVAFLLARRVKEGGLRRYSKWIAAVQNSITPSSAFREGRLSISQVKEHFNLSKTAEWRQVKKELYIF